LRHSRFKTCAPYLLRSVANASHNWLRPTIRETEIMRNIYSITTLIAALFFVCGPSNGQNMKQISERVDQIEKRILKLEKRSLHFCAAEITTSGKSNQSDRFYYKPSSSCFFEGDEENGFSGIIEVTVLPDGRYEKILTVKIGPKSSGSDIELFINGQGHWKIDDPHNNGKVSVTFFDNFFQVNFIDAVISKNQVAIRDGSNISMRRSDHKLSSALKTPEN